MTATTSPAARMNGKPYVVTGPGSASPVAVSAAANDSAPIAAAVTPASTATPVRTGQAAARLTVGGACVMGPAYGVARRSRRRQASGGNRSPALRVDPQQALALIDHRSAIVVPVGVFTGDGAVVLDQRIERVGQVHHLRRAVDLDIGVAEVVRHHDHAG